MFACVSVFDRPCSAWPARLIALGIKMFTLHGTRFRITGLCLCASYVLAKIIKGVNNICLLTVFMLETLKSSSVKTGRTKVDDLI